MQYEPYAGVGQAAALLCTKLYGIWTEICGTFVATRSCDMAGRRYAEQVHRDELPWRRMSGPAAVCGTKVRRACAVDMGGTEV